MNKQSSYTPECSDARKLLKCHEQCLELAILTCTRTEYFLLSRFVQCSHIVRFESSVL